VLKYSLFLKARHFRYDGLKCGTKKMLTQKINNLMENIHPKCVEYVLQIYAVLNILYIGKQWGLNLILVNF